MAIRQIATALFERLSVSGEGEGMSEGEGEGVGGEGEKGRQEEQRMSQEAGDAYLLFQV